MQTHYAVIVIGGGHAGTEAAWAAASVLDSAGRGGRVALITMDPSKIGTMSCNPAIGGLAKGQMVREIDALGGIMGRAIDATGIQFKMLNTSKGPAVHGPRAQADKYAYAAEVQRLLSTRSSIDVIAGTIDDIVVEDGAVIGVMLPAGCGVVEADQQAIALNQRGDALARPVYPAKFESSSTAARMVRCDAAVLTTGTFMRGLMHTGERKSEGGRVGEGSAVGISATLRRLGFELGRLKTGTPPRLERDSLDWINMPAQHGDEQPVAFSDLSPEVLISGRFPTLRQVECRVTETNAAIHDAIRANLHRAPMFIGQIDAECGPRYCPSIEDKVVRFADRASHHVYLEPESLHTNEIYCNGISTSLPIDVQERIVRGMAGCEHTKVLRWGYAVEYDMIWPHQIDATCMTKLVRGLFTAGQINGTSGYEEAGGQGLIAGLNAARLSLGEELIRIGRDAAYLGVMMDDLVTKTPREPYRMFTSRAEYRLLLRADNADSRLTQWGSELGLVDEVRLKRFEARAEMMERVRSAMEQRLVDGKPLSELVRRPEFDVDAVMRHMDTAHEAQLLQRVVTEFKYAGYIRRQHDEVRRRANHEERSIPKWVDYQMIPGLRAEAAQVLSRFQPATMGQAGRLAGVNPADMTLLAVAIRRGPRNAEVER